MDKTKVLYDFQIFSWQKYGGISRYFFELYNFFKETIPVRITIKYSINEYFGNNSNQFFLINLKGKNRLLYILNKWNAIRVIKKGDFDIFHPTYYDPYFLKYLKGKPFVLTVHDMIHEKASHYFKDAQKIISRKKLLIKKADHIIAISEQTKNDIVHLYPESSGKISVIYHGNSLKILDKENEKTILPKKYILFVGQRSNYKNFDRFIKAIAEILKKHTDLHLICAGGGKFKDDEIEQLKMLSIFNQVTQHNISDTKLVEMYSRAEIFVFPSLLEGFGIPLLEAMSIGCPTIASSIDCFKEVGGDALLYFDPLDENDIKNRVEYALNNSENMKTLVERGRNRVKEFSWSTTAELTLQVYDKILKEKEL